MLFRCGALAQLLCSVDILAIRPGKVIGDVSTHKQRVHDVARRLMPE